MGYFLVTTDHLTDRIWFRDSDDFRAGMNLVAVVAITLNVNVLAFILMSNHVHFVLECRKEMAELFINEFKKQYSRYFRLKYGTRELLRRNNYDIQDLNLSDESLERAIAYVLMNCVAANICSDPSSYPWGTGSCYFQVSTRKGKRLDSLTGRKQIRLLHSKAKLPSGLIVSEDGYILPESYVKYRFVESVFRTPKRLKYFLDNSSKAKHRIASSESNLPSFRDQVVFPAITDLCNSVFGVSSVSKLNQEQLGELFRQIRYRFSSNIEQIARVTGFPIEIVSDLLDSFNSRQY